MGARFRHSVAYGSRSRQCPPTRRPSSRPSRKPRQVVAGDLREAVPGVALYAREDIQRVALKRAGISDPISMKDAAALLGMNLATFQFHLKRGHYRGLHVFQFWFFSRAEIERHACRRAQLIAALDRLHASGMLLTGPEAAKRLGISEVALYNAIRKRLIRAVVVRSLRRTYFKATEIERVIATRAVKGPRRAGLPKELLVRREAAELLGVSPREAGYLVDSGTLRAVAQGGRRGHGPRGFRRVDVERVRAERERRARLLRPGQAARMLGISLDSLRLLVRRGLLHNEGSASVRLFDPDEVKALRSHSLVTHLRSERRRHARARRRAGARARLSPAG